MDTIHAFNLHKHGSVHYESSFSFQLTGTDEPRRTSVSRFHRIARRVGVAEKIERIAECIRLESAKLCANLQPISQPANVPSKASVLVECNGQCGVVSEGASGH